MRFPTSDPAVREHVRAVPPELTFLAVCIALALMLALAGVPQRAQPLAGEGSNALQQGWLARHQAEAAESSKQGRGLDAPVVPAQR